ncbi:6-hydroxymethylpterin diphosphokinase MptE-like protein [Marinobacter sp.]|uniref:motility associated factor glycosyltransferase family protein n=1 Tax=Marinobacter sp. TaxID=50741 RepID=UPI002B26CB09|nr:6-hydroxymethylpterin diphosphokinase MptE-like protein [Marinobacter sp.]
MTRKNKSLDRARQDEGQEYMYRLERNLAYFKRHRPALYQMLSSMELQRVELVVTPGKGDVDMVEQQKSCYRGLAKEYSVNEANRMLQENEGSRRILTFPPPSAKNYPRKNFASDLLRKVISNSPVAKTGFRGYWLDDFFPSVVFLGCGLGYHIEEVCKRAEIINAIIVEREPEKFAVSLYTVDWEGIFNRFRQAGRTLNFAIGKADTKSSIKALVDKSMAKDLPFYPFFSTYYNHLADVQLAKGVVDASNDIAVLTTNWTNYDEELVRLVNTTHNAKSGMSYLANLSGKSISCPMAVVGSGPSIDNRLESLKKMRDKLFVVSAGTGLKPLLAAGITPDLHLELDPSYIIYQLHCELPRDVLAEIPLLAVNEVNPLVCSLFKDVTYFFKSDNMLPKLIAADSDAFAGCNPTVTNAATAIGSALGFRKIYLFGTDYGFKDEGYHHARDSAWGKEYAEPIKQREERMKTEGKPARRIFEVDGVCGTRVLTRNDYYTAKRSLEDFLAQVAPKMSPDFQVYNCADGAVIDNTQWLSSTEFEAGLCELAEPVFDTEKLFSGLKKELAIGAFDASVVKVHEELKRVCYQYKRIIEKARVSGRKDLCLLVNRLRVEAVTVSPSIGAKEVRSEQIYCAQLLKGSMLHFLATGLCHGMTCEDHEIREFLAFWKVSLLEFLARVPEHFKIVILSGKVLEEDPWVRRNRDDDDPYFEEV